MERARQDEADERDLRMIDMALAEARAALAAGGAGVGAVLARGDEVLAVAHNRSRESGDMTDHAEMAALRQAARRLQALSDEERAGLAIYVTLEPCLMCAAALSFVGVRRVVYAALAEDMNEEELIVRGLTVPAINGRLVRGPFALVPGVRRAEGQALIAAMGKQPGTPPDLK